MRSARSLTPEPSGFGVLPTQAGEDGVVAGLVSIATTAGVGLWATLAGGALAANSAARAHLGLHASAAAVLVDDVARAMPAGDARRFGAAAREAARLTHRFIGTYARHDGRLIEISAEACRRTDGALVLVQGTSLDRTDGVQAESTLQAISASTPALLWVMDPEGRCSFFSESWTRFTGQSTRDAMGTGWIAMVHPEDLGAADRKFRDAVRRRSPFESVHRLLHFSGQWRWVLCVGEPRFGDDGRFLGHSGAVTDIHERRVAEQLLVNSEERYRTFVAGSSDGICRLEFLPPLDTRMEPGAFARRFAEAAVVAECNDAFARAHGVGAAQPVRGMRLRELFARHRIDAESLGLRFLALSFRLQEHEMTLAPAGKAPVHVSLNITGIVERGMLLRAWCVQRDTTLRRKYEQFLLREARTNSEFRRFLAEELRSRLTPIRRALASAPNASPAERSVQAKREILKQRVDQVAATMDALLAASSPEARDAKQGATASLVWEPARTVQLVVRLLSQAVEAAIDADREALRLYAEKGRLLAAAAHDLRQPLQALALAVDSLGNRSRGGPLEADVGVLREAIEGMGRLLEGMLDLSRLDASAGPVGQGPVSLAALFVELHRRFADRADAKGLGLRFAHRNLWVASDPDLLLRLLSNLVDNAIKYTAEGGVLVAARVTDRAGTPHVRIEVRDSGRGIAKEEQADVFREFHRVGAGPAAEQGLGLGLSIVERLAGLLGLRVHVRSCPGRGSTFTVQPLPIHASGR